MPRPHKMAEDVYSAEPTILNNSAKYEPILMKLETWTHRVLYGLKNTKPEVPRPHNMAAKVFNAEHVWPFNSAIYEPILIKLET